MPGRIVVGIDCSARSHAILEFAYEEARRRGDTLSVLHAYVAPAYWGVPEFGAVSAPRPHEEIAGEAQDRLSQCVGTPPDDVEVKQVAVEGPAARSLLDAAEGADVLIVGTRGHGGFLGLLLGSTCHQVVTHASCPVLVVPTPDDG